MFLPLIHFLHLGYPSLDNMPEELAQYILKTWFQQKPYNMLYKLLPFELNFDFKHNFY